ncbi:MAG TPA: DNA replication/repair protein RecF [Acidimicrobiales bacterium]|nr:DNA replication/repair protein RecF [Acidimicrobiales bacterium]
MSLHLRRLWLTDFRSYASADVTLPPGTTAIIGRNGQGKTNLLEAVAYLAGSSLRGAATEAMVRVGAERAVVRAEATRGPRELLLEAEIALRGRSRMQLNRQPVKRRRDLLDALSVTLFSPDDLVLVKGGPSERRRWLDDAAVGLDHQTESVRSDVERILKQRNALLKQCRGRLDEAAALTLDVWDDRLARAGTALAERRAAALADLVPRLTQAYRDLAGRPLPVSAAYEAPWRPGGLAAALAEARDQDLRRGVTTVGPHRDDVVFALDELPARTHASQGEQRSLALALRLSVHRAITEVSGESPILLLDDVLSELDDDRTEALLAHLPPGQTLLTTAGPLPRRTEPQLVLRVADGAVTPADGPAGATSMPHS